jgi:hypothetical protein
MPDETKNALDLFLAAIEIASLGERHAYLDPTCANNAALQHHALGAVAVAPENRQGKGGILARRSGAPAISAPGRVYSVDGGRGG